MIIFCYDVLCVNNSLNFRKQEIFLCRTYLIKVLDANSEKIKNEVTEYLFNIYFYNSLN